MISKDQVTPVHIQAADFSVIDQEQFNIREVHLRSVAPIMFNKPFYDATMGPFYQYKPCFLKLVDSDGNEGECEFPMGMTYILKEIFLPVLFSSWGKTYLELFNALFWGIRNEGFRGAGAMALGHLDRVLYDLASKRMNLPLYRYLGAKNNSVRVYASGGGINLIGEELKEECLQWESQDYKTIKIKFGGFKTSVAEDIQRVTSIREVLSPETRLAIDANQFMGLKRALEFVGNIEGHSFAWLEEPMHSAALHEIETLSAATGLKISYGESERSKMVFPSIVRAGVAHLQPIAGHLSSVKDWFEVAQLAQRHQLDLSSGGTSFFNAPFLAAVGDNALLEYLEPIIGPLSEILSVRPQISNGCFKVPDIPGIGTAVDWERLTKEKKITNHGIWKK